MLKPIRNGLGRPAPKQKVQTQAQRSKELDRAGRMKQIAQDVQLAFEHMADVIDQAAASQVLKDKPQAVFGHDVRTGRSLLQIAVEKGASVDLLTEICKRNPDLLKETYADLTPFQHIIDKYPISNLEAQYLGVMLEQLPNLARCEHGEMTQETPLHKLAKATHYSHELQDATVTAIKIFPSACATFADGELPLHRFIAAGASSLQVLTALLSAYPGAASIRPTSGRQKGILPLHACLISRLEHRVIKRVFRAYPAAVLKRMVGTGLDDTPLEFALKNKLGHNSIELLAFGGHHHHNFPKGRPFEMSYTRAAILGYWNREWSFEQIQAEDTNEMSSLLKRRQKKRCTVYVRPYHHTAAAFKIVMDETAPVEELQEVIHAREGSPPNLQHLEDKTGRRLVEGQPMRTYADDKKVVTVYLHQINDILHIALREANSLNILVDILRVLPSAAKQQDFFGRLPLHTALEHECDSSIVESLYNSHPTAVTETSGKNGYALDIAVTKDAGEQVVRMFLAHVRKGDWTEEGHYKPISEVEQTHVGGGPPFLHMCIQHHYSLKLIDFLLYKTGYPVQARDKASGTTGFEAALIYQAADAIIEEIKECHERIDPDFLQNVGRDGRTPIHTAAASGVSAHILEVIATASGFHLFKVRDHNGQLPLHLAATHRLGFEAVREIALAYPEAVSQPDSLHRTPLALAISHEAPPGVVFEMGRHVVNILKIRDNHNRSLLLQAVRHDAPLHIIHELLELSPEFIDEVSLVTGEWTSTEAGQEVKRLALEPRSKLQGAGSMSWAQDPLLHSELPVTPSSPHIVGGRRSFARHPLGTHSTSTDEPSSMVHSHGEDDGNQRSFNMCPTM